MIAALLSALCPVTATAQSQPEGKSLMVQKKNGDTHYYLLASGPVITFKDDVCSIQSPDFSAQYPMAEIDFARFVDGPDAGIDEPSTSIVIDLSDPAYAHISGLQAQAIVNLYSVSGSLISRTSADDAGSASVSLERLQAGVYIISTAKTTFKIYKK